MKTFVAVHRHANGETAFLFCTAIDPGEVALVVLAERLGIPFEPGPGEELAIIALGDDPLARIAILAGPLAVSTATDSKGLSSDAELSAEDLDDRYNPEGDGEHPVFRRLHWRNAVAHRETLVSYWEWVAWRLRTMRRAHN